MLHAVVPTMKENDLLVMPSMDMAVMPPSTLMLDTMANFLGILGFLGSGDSSRDISAMVPSPPPSSRSPVGASRLLTTPCWTGCLPGPMLRRIMRSMPICGRERTHTLAVDQRNGPGASAETAVAAAAAAGGTGARGNSVMATSEQVRRLGRAQPGGCDRHAWDQRPGTVTDLHHITGGGANIRILVVVVNSDALADAPEVAQLDVTAVEVVFAGFVVPDLEVVVPARDQRIVRVVQELDGFRELVVGGAAANRGSGCNVPHDLHAAISQPWDPCCAHAELAVYTLSLTVLAREVG